MSELFHNFGVDWRLLIAQAINFLVVLIVLKRFAYTPIVQMLRRRREDIEQGLTASKEARERLAKAEELKEAVAEKAREEALAVVSHAERLAKKRKEEIAAEATRKGEAILAEAKRAVRQEKAKMGEEVYASAHELVRLGLARVLGKMPAEKRDEPLIAEALKELKAIK